MAEVIEYLKPRRIWVDDGHVFAEGHDGTTMRMQPEVAIELGRLLEHAGTESFINKVLDHAADPAAQDGVAKLPTTP